MHSIFETVALAENGRHIILVDDVIVQTSFLALIWLKRKPSIYCQKQ